MTDPIRPIDADVPPARREFLTRLATLSALAAGSGMARRARAGRTAGRSAWHRAERAALAPSQTFTVHWRGPDRQRDCGVPGFDVTPSDRMYIRNNLLTPDLDASKHVLRVTGLVDKPLQLSLADLKKLPSSRPLRCSSARVRAERLQPRERHAGRRRRMGCPRDRSESRRHPEARWRNDGAVHVAFSRRRWRRAHRAEVIRSIPMSKAMERHTMAEGGMNGAICRRSTAICCAQWCPDVGSASIKWVSGIDVLDAPFKGTFMDDSYRIPRTPVARARSCRRTRSRPKRGR
jgi:DMSO/TMAO reductase YedYZ molybdopterin-dependent catalytic subunit